jgi:DNA-binding transcriptional regulator YiaG
MKNTGLRRIRTDANLTLGGLAKVLRISDLSSVHRWEKGTREISGPVSILMELIDNGELPQRYFTEQPPR